MANLGDFFRQTFGSKNLVDTALGANVARHAPQPPRKLPRFAQVAGQVLRPNDHDRHDDEDAQLAKAHIEHESKLARKHTRVGTPRARSHRRLRRAGWLSVDYSEKNLRIRPSKSELLSSALRACSVGLALSSTELACRSAMTRLMC